jgi:transcriptional regulator with XRE-family HTH domain
MTRDHAPNGDPPDNLLPLSAGDELFFDALVAHLVRPASPFALGENSCAVLERTCPPVEPSRRLQNRIQVLGRQAELDAAFMDGEVERDRKPSLGGYLVYLRTHAGLSVSEAARRLRVPLQLLADLERDGLRPDEIPARRLAETVRRLSGGLEMTERLVLATVRAPRLRLPAGAARLYRGGAGATRQQSEAASRAARGEAGEMEENPDWLREREAAQRLAAELRRVWR